MKRYIILTQQSNPLNVATVLFQPYYIKKHEFSSYDDALKFASTLNFGVTIYESIAETTIEHNVKTIEKNKNENNRNTSGLKS